MSILQPVKMINMKELLLFLVLLFLMGNANAQITSGEYFFDIAPTNGGGTAISFTSGNTVNETVNIPLTTLSSGFHNVFIRVKDATDTWSHYEGRTIYIIPTAEITAQPNLVSGEWFLDTDPGIGNGTAINFAQGNSVNTTIALNTAALVPGFHNLFIRVKDANNVWSHYEGRTFYVIPTANTTPQPNLVSGEWFLDTDPGIGNGTAINFAQANSVNTTIALNTAALVPGFHNLFIRVKDANNVWSHYEGRTFYVIPTSNTTPQPNLVSGEWFIDSDPGIGKGTAINFTAAASINPTIMIPTPTLSSGVHHLFIRVKDANNVWSLYEGRQFTYTALTTPSVVNISICKGAAGVTPTATPSFGYELVWYASATPIALPLATAPIVTTVTKTFYVAQRLIGGGPLSTRVAVTVTVSALPATPGTISTTDTVLCKYIGTSNTVTYTVPAGASSYSWTLPSGVNAIGATNANSITVNFLNANTSTATGGVGTISVRALSSVGCSSAPRSLILSSKLPTAPTSLILTSEDMALDFDVAGVPTSLSSLPKITKVGPYVGPATEFILTAPVAPTAASYEWTLPSGVNQLSGGISNVITVNFAGVTAGITALPITVQSVGGCGSSLPRTLSLTRVLPTAPTALVLTESPSAVALTKVSAYTGKLTELTLTATPARVQGATATSYAWILPAGVNCLTSSTPTTVQQSVNTGTFTPEGAPIYAIQNFDAIATSSSTITIDFSDVALGVTSFPLSVFAVNGTGNSKARTRIVTAAAPVSPAIVSSPSTTFNSCSTRTYTAVSIPGASYNWTVPAGATFTGGTENVIVVNYTNVVAAIGVTVQVSCSASNGTGSSLPKIVNVKRVACPIVRVANSETTSIFDAVGYPNPFSNYFTLDLTSPIKAPVVWSVFDISGRLIETRKLKLSEIAKHLRFFVWSEFYRERRI